MKRKILAVIAITVVLILILTNMFSKGVITGKLYRVDNVYEEIWNLVNSEKNGKQTILTTSTEGAEVIYGLGFFEQVSIPLKDEYYISLSFHDDELCILLFKENSETGDSIWYVYNERNNTLYGDHAESLLLEVFILPYYSWVGSDGKFNPKNHGKYTFKFDEYPLTHD